MSSLQHWDTLVRPYLASAELEAQIAIRHVHNAGYLIAEICERPNFETRAEDELNKLADTLERALKDVRRVQAAYHEKRIETPHLQAAE